MTILYEDNHLLAVNKAVGEIVQGDKTGDTPLCETLKAYIKDKYNKPGDVFLGVPHRLDRPTTGVVLFARTSKALTRLNDMFRAKSAEALDSADVSKTYWAIVQGQPPTPEATLDNYLLRNEKQNKSYIVRPGTRDAKHALLTYRTLACGDRYSLLEIHLLTGRHHQIRCQLAAIGCPVKGDLKYGARRSNPDGGICLHARALTLTHPVARTTLTITAPTPPDPLWQQLFPHQD
ncbi:MAG: RluA family pseudouridine synthase [Paludibacteraceae bacterium]|nr:RluA family pseudouridine synthase [Paludibacteraceae bacterium]